MSVFPDDIFAADPLALIDAKMGAGYHSYSLECKQSVQRHIFCENGSRRVCWHAKTDVGKIILNTYMI